MITLHDFGRTWQLFFHAPEPVATLCVFRLLFGLLLVVNSCNLLLFADDFFGPSGFLSTRGFAKVYPRSRLTVFSLLPPTTGSARGIVIALLAASAALAIGLCTPLCTPLAWLLLTSLHHRNSAIFNAGDTLQRLLLLLLCFAPSGSALSVDSLLRGEDPIQSLRDHQFNPWPLRLIQIQISIVYLRAVYWKLRGKTWREGTAVAYVLHSMGFRRVSAPQLIDLPGVAPMLTYGTMIAEFYVPIALWSRELRYSAIIVGVLLHLTFELFMNVHLFGITMCVGLVTFIPPNDIIRLFGR